MGVEFSLKQKLIQKHEEIAVLLRRANHDISTFQYHLDANSIENIYWHHGYLSALEDMLALLQHEETRSSKEVVQHTNHQESVKEPVKEPVKTQAPWTPPAKEPVKEPVMSRSRSRRLAAQGQPAPDPEKLP